MGIEGQEMTDSMIDRLEIAIRQAINTHWDGTILTGGHGLLARAALEELRVPTDAMLKAYPGHCPNWKDLWQAMIEEALK